MMRKPLLIVSILLVGCQRGNPEDSALSGPASPAAALAAIGGAVTLDQALQLLDRELVLALRNEGDVGLHLEKAEAITDRLLETRMPFPWIASRSYGVEPILRQIQTLADRVVAERRSGVRPETIRRDLVDLHELVRGLRIGIRTGGGPAPATLDSLLARYASDTLAASTRRGGE